MGSILLQIGLFAAGLLLIAYFVKWYTALCYRLIVTKKDEALEIVLSTREVPNAWRRRFIEKFALSKRNPLRRITQRLLICAYMWRVKRLQTFIKSNRRLNADQRQADIETLKDIQSEWRACRTLEELISR